ncbi:glycosyltransferase [Terrarubrum flagellatum]|uniref:glycosyltransferase n=1 Tax=Terrirubrum flagellatum TaxID=2895980 RepID=UPI0031455D7B
METAEERPSIVFLLSHSAAGGVQEIWANLAEGFRARGFKVSLMALYPHPDTLRQTSVDLPWQYFASKRPSAPGAHLSLLVSLIRFFRRKAPALAFTAMPAANVLAPLAARLAGARTKVVISHHSPVETHNRLLNVADSWIGSWDNVPTIISVSNSVGASLQQKPSRYRAKRRTIYNALPPMIESQVAALAARRRERQGRGRKVIATGRLAAQKNYPVLVRAAAHLPDVTIDVVGGGADEQALKALVAELGVGDRIRFLGPRSREATLELLAEGDVFVQPSLFEGHSLALIEAAKLNLPLVVSDVPTQIEGVTAADGTVCGITTPVHDPVALANEIRRLLDDRACYEHWQARAAHLAESFTYDGMIAEYEKLVA